MGTVPKRPRAVKMIPVGTADADTTPDESDDDAAPYALTVVAAGFAAAEIEISGGWCAQGAWREQTHRRTDCTQLPAPARRQSQRRQGNSHRRHSHGNCAQEAPS